MNAHADIEHDMEGEAPDMHLETLFGDCRDAMLLRIQTMKTSWALCNESEQTEIINGLELAAKSIVRAAVREVTRNEFPHAVVTLGEVKIKGEKGIEGKIVCSNIEHNRNVLGDHVGSMVQLVMVDSEEFMGERNPAEADPDQADWLNCPDHEDGDDEEPRGLPKPEDFD
jgi:hypothetical protein